MQWLVLHSAAGCYLASYLPVSHYCVSPVSQTLNLEGTPRALQVVQLRDTEASWRSHWRLLPGVSQQTLGKDAAFQQWWPLLQAGQVPALAGPWHRHPSAVWCLPADSCG